MFTGSFLILLKLQMIKKKTITLRGHTFFLLFSRTSTCNPPQRAACNFFCCDVGGLAGGESRDFCVQNTTEEMCSWTGCRQRWGKRGNYHIERGEDGGEGFKIDLIFLDPLHPSSPPCFLSFHFFFFGSVQWACSVLFCQTQGEHREELKWRRTGRRGEALGQGEQWTCFWGRFKSEVPT